MRRASRLRHRRRRRRRLISISSAWWDADEGEFDA